MSRVKVSSPEYQNLIEIWDFEIYGYYFGYCLGVILLAGCCPVIYGHQVESIIMQAGGGDGGQEQSITSSRLQATVSRRRPPP